MVLKSTFSVRAVVVSFFESCFNYPGTCANRKCERDVGKCNAKCVFYAAPQLTGYQANRDREENHIADLHRRLQGVVSLSKIQLKTNFKCFDLYKDIM